MSNPRQRLLAEGLGTAALLAAVVGSGIMGDRLAGGNDAIALLANTFSTSAMLAVLILILAHSSGAHFNPAVSLVAAMLGRLTWREFALYSAVQVTGGVAGVWLAHVMFDLPVIQLGAVERAGVGQWVSEAVATGGLLLTILLCSRRAPAAVPWAVALYIAAAYWFTASTSFANPAVTLARMFTDTFAGIRPLDAPAFILVQLGVALVVGWGWKRWSA